MYLKMNSIESIKRVSEEIKAMSGGENAISTRLSIHDLIDNYYKIKIFNAYVECVGGMSVKDALKISGITNLTVKKYTGMTLSQLKSEYSS